MAAFKHGASTSEAPTSILAPATAAAGIPVFFGTAPVNQSTSATAPVNVPMLCYKWEEAVAAIGYSDAWDDYTLCEAMDSHFGKYQLAPAVFVNVLDPSTHKTAVADAVLSLSSGAATIEAEGVLLSTVVVKSEDKATTFQTPRDYTIGFNGSGQVLLTVKNGGTIPVAATKLSVSYSKLNPAAVTAAEIIGGVDSTTGKSKGLELLQQVFPRFGIVPGLVLAPGFSVDPTVAAVMVAKAGNINGHFKALAVTDIPTDIITKYTDAPSWKRDNNYTSERQIACYPKVKLGDKQYHLSTQLAGVIGATDTANNDVPYVSPSNKALKAVGAVLEDGTELYLGPDQAAYLNSQGIVTALNFMDGWKSWGNQTGAYPGSTDPKNAFIAIRRMFDWVSNTIILTYWQKVDSPGNNRLIETVTDSLNIWLNGLTSAGYLLGGRVEFQASENPVTDLMNGTYKFHVYLTPPGPAQEINFVLEYDPQYLQSLFAA
ncbi:MULTISPECIES: phage tail sheath family protein [Paenibacillus]|uniref:phage tail sheath family protein n=1 Tax=Paenibacillus TaxID=44249 RepID=UPI0022B8F615|nr:phage tail sheath family protein [Paenibacillus caseinilyticus]MCZ8520127.1 phage tail sheath family protein [Paenibacillus caseinilyticus]